MKQSTVLAVLVLCSLTLSVSQTPVFAAEKTVEVGGADSKDHTTLVAAVKAAGCSHRPMKLSVSYRRAQSKVYSSPRQNPLS